MPEPGAARVDAREIRHRRGHLLHRGGTVGPQHHAAVVRMGGGEAPVAPHDRAQVVDGEHRVRRLAEIEVDGAVRLLPAVAVVEMEAGRQVVAADRGERVLLHHDHAGAELGPPDVGIEKADGACSEALRLDHEW